MSFKATAMRFMTRKRTLKIGFLAGTTLGGGVIAASVSQPGLRHEGFKEGMSHGALLGAVPFVARPIAKVFHKGLKATYPAFAKANKAAATGYKTVFRKFRGRIVPIKVKV